MEFFAWAFIGALIGFAASHKRGFPMASGILGGLALGPLAFILFAFSPSANEAKKCPHCAEFIKPEAKVCKHCGRDVVDAAAAPERTARRTPSGKCSKCGHLLPATTTRCAKCQAAIQSDAA